VGWFQLANSASLHEEALPVIQALANVVDWVWVGDCPLRFRPYVTEVRPSVHGEARALYLAGLDLDLAVCRLPFDGLGEWMDALPLLELGSLGYPIVCSDVAAFRVDLPVQRIGSNAQDWAEAIHAAVQDRALLMEQGAMLREQVTQRLSAEEQKALMQAYLP
jgi:glycosyltransferase involved in cell wall biosynthesis